MDKKRKNRICKNKEQEGVFSLHFLSLTIVAQKEGRPTICKKRILVSKEKRSCSFWERKEDNISSHIIESPPIIISKLGFLSIILTLTLTIRSDFQVRISLPFLQSFLDFPLSQIIFFFHFCFFFRCQFSVFIFSLKLFLLCLLCLVLSIGSSSLRLALMLNFIRIRSFHGCLS